jgi:hypothetical protein
MMTEHSFEYKALRFLNDRIERYDITDHSLKIALYDIPENEYIQGMDHLKNVGYVKNKELYEKGLSITPQGQVKLQQLQRIVDNEKKQETQFKIKYPLGLSQELFWTLLIALVSGAFGFGIYFGSNKFDRNLIELSETNKELKDTIKVRENTITYIRHNSDSALNILSHMPYNEMTLDTLSFRKVQTTIENAGAALNLNK